VDSSGNAYVAGTTGATDFPTTTGAFQTTLPNRFDAAFVAKLNTSGARWFMAPIWAGAAWSSPARFGWTRKATPTYSA